MKTAKEQAEKILKQLQKATDARIRSMMGEYIVYVDEKVVGQINHNQLFIKMTQFGEAFAPELKRESPYDGAKLAFVVPPSRIDDTNWLKDFISGTTKQLPAKK